MTEEQRCLWHTGIAAAFMARGLALVLFSGSVGYALVLKTYFNPNSFSRNPDDVKVITANARLLGGMIFAARLVERRGVAMERSRGGAVRGSLRGVFGRRLEILTFGVKCFRAKFCAVSEAGGACLRRKENKLRRKFTPFACSFLFFLHWCAGCAAPKPPAQKTETLAQARQGFKSAILRRLRDEPKEPLPAPPAGRFSRRDVSGAEW